MKYNAEMMLLGDRWFLYLYNDASGGRMVSIDNVISIVPNFKQGGAMVFLKNTDKAISVDQPPEEIAESLRRKQ